MIPTRRLAAAAVLLASAALPASAWAQREIVQALPSEGERELNAALTRLAANAADVGALLDAGNAALKLDDIEAAIGFFGRANELRPGNASSKLGLAKAYTRARRPVEALLLFAEAERAGVSNARMAENRALAFDLVGDTASAQELYRLALAEGAGAPTRRRLALNQAISGDREGFEATLLPLLERGDVTAFRTRAFGLAILGDTEEAKTIANTMLPSGLGARLASYFDYMPRLTRAQQAAAGNLGVFPLVANIGTDEQGIADYAGSPVRIVRAEPQVAVPAPPPPPPTRQTRERPTVAQPAQSEPQPARRQGFYDRWGRERPAPVTRAASEAVESEPVAPPPPPPPPPSPPPPPPPPASDPVVVARAQAPAPVASQPAAEPVPEPETVSLDEAFSSFTLAPSEPDPSRAGAVDITRIDIPRERAEPPPPVHPARHWVQVATGRDLAALRFDWRRIARQAEGALDGKGPFTAPWGVANRLLAGPYDSAAEAREMVNQLRGLGLDSFPFASGEGEAINDL